MTPLLFIQCYPSWSYFSKLCLEVKTKYWSAYCSWTKWQSFRRIEVAETGMRKLLWKKIKLIWKSWVNQLVPTRDADIMKFTIPLSTPQKTKKQNVSPIHLWISAQYEITAMLSGQQRIHIKQHSARAKILEKKWACVSCNYFLKTICLHPLLLIMYRTPAFLSTVPAFWIKMQWASFSLSRYCSHGHPRVRISCCDYTWWILQRADCSKMTSDRGRGNEGETQRWMPSYLSSRQECAIINYKKIVHWLIVILSGQCLMIYRSSLTLLSHPSAN